jgi:hypothetical protein
MTSQNMRAAGIEQPAQNIQRDQASSKAAAIGGPAAISQLILQAAGQTA